MVNRQENFIKFLGTAGARFVMLKQLRASGGLWVSQRGTNVLIDPGPGSLLRCAASRPKLDPAKLDAVILTHRHLDHANDINVMLEAMTEGGFKKKRSIILSGRCHKRRLRGIKIYKGFSRKNRALRS